MNKDVIYIEPEDDITDIVTKIENSQSKIVAIVPPKKADILHSSINIKLINKAGKNSDKKIVLVTRDTTIIKHAATVKMPITKDLQSAPVIPTIKITDGTKTEEETDESEFDELNNKKKSAKTEKAEAEAETEPDPIEESEAIIEEELVEEADEETDKNNHIELSADDVKEEPTVKEAKKLSKKEAKEAKKAKKAEKSEKTPKNKVLAWFKKYRKWFYIGTPILAVLIVALVWAFVIAPAVDIKIKVRTDIKNFSENISFTTSLENENISEGRFYLEEKKIDTPATVKFEATGKKNIGEKAKGSVIVYAYFRESGVIAINAGSSFTSQDLTFYADEDTTFGWDGESVSDCNNNDGSLVTAGCLIYTRVNVTAAEAGSDYNIAQNKSWTTAASVKAYSDAAMAGGTDRTITVVQQSDIDKAKSKLIDNKDNEEKKKTLLESISEDNLIIESSLHQFTSDIVSTPALGEEVAEGVEPALTTTATTSVYVVDLTKIREFITEKAKVPEKDHIYAIGNPFVESFTGIENGYTGRLKTNYTIGPNISEQTVLEKIKGVRIGNIKPILSDEGASEVEITRSYPWVNSVPNDENKITITIKEE